MARVGGKTSKKLRPEAPASVDKDWLEATKTFEAATGKKMTIKKGRYPFPTEKQLQKALRMNNVEYFRAILSDQAEMDLWYMFMTGTQPERDSHGNPIIVDDRIVTKEVDLNPVQLKAFLRAVEYKRGQPVTIDPAVQGQTGMKVTFECVGATPEFFIQTGKESGLIK
jgi:DNA-directed RNA polymerase specialized sigma subunit